MHHVFATLTRAKLWTRNSDGLSTGTVRPSGLMQFSNIVTQSDGRQPDVNLAVRMDGQMDAAPHSAGMKTNQN